jgi:hypothetical protein
LGLHFPQPRLLDFLELGMACIASHLTSSEELLQLLSLLAQQLQLLVHLEQSIIRALVINHMPGTLNYFVGKCAHLGRTGCHGGVPPGSLG